MVDFDVTVVGGGIVGLTAALAIANSGFSVAVVDPELREAEIPKAFDPRSYALTVTSIRILENLGVWPALDSTRNAEVRSMSVWDANSRGHIRFSPFPAGERSFGVITENTNLLRALQGKIGIHKNIEALERRAISTKLSGGYRELEFSTGPNIRTQLVVCCDGGSSPMRERLGIITSRHSYEQRAMVVNVKTTMPHEFVAKQVFHHEGPLAFLPLADENQCAVVWTNSKSTSEVLTSITPEVFINRLNEAAQLMGEVECLTSERQDFPLFKMHVKKYDTERAVLVGDSAHVIHPLAGQGLNLGIMDAAVLAHVMKVDSPIEGQTLLQQPKPALRRYSRWRAGDNQLMVLATDSLNKLFSRRETWVRSLRGAGLNTTNKISPLMRIFTKHAMGKAGELPHLAKVN